jgi:hypothetical protein
MATVSADSVRPTTRPEIAPYDRIIRSMDTLPGGKWSRH